MDNAEKLCRQRNRTPNMVTYVVVCVPEVLKNQSTLVEQQDGNNTG